MADILVRDVRRQIVARLKARAREGGRSLQAEVRRILEQAASTRPTDAVATAARIRRRLAGRRHGDSARLIERDRAR